VEITMINDFYTAWRYLEEHPIFGEKVIPNFNDDFCKEFGITSDLGNEPYFESHFTTSRCLDINVVKVNPITMAIDDNKELNTKVEIWLEAGAYRKECATHDYDLDCGADTFEEAIVKLANLVQQKFGDDYDKAMELVEEQFGDSEYKAF
jgi:hypothetical protein